MRGNQKTPGSNDVVETGRRPSSNHPSQTGETKPSMEGVLRHEVAIEIRTEWESMMEKLKADIDPSERDIGDLLTGMACFLLRSAEKLYSCGEAEINVVAEDSL